MNEATILPCTNIDVAPPILHQHGHPTAYLLNPGLQLERKTASLASFRVSMKSRNEASVVVSRW